MSGARFVLDPNGSRRQLSPAAPLSFAGVREQQRASVDPLHRFERREAVVRKANARWTAADFFRRQLTSGEGSLLAGWEELGFDYDEAIPREAFLAVCQALRCPRDARALWAFWAVDGAVGLAQIQPRVFLVADAFYREHVAPGRATAIGDEALDELSFVQLLARSPGEVADAQLLYAELAGRRPSVPMARLEPQGWRRARKPLCVEASQSTMVPDDDEGSFVTGAVEARLHELAELLQDREAWLAAPWRPCGRWRRPATTRRNVAHLRTVFAAGPDELPAALRAVLEDGALSAGACRAAARRALAAL